MDINQQLQDELNAAQTALAEAEISLLEANAAATSLREKAARLQAAVAALNGESPLRGEPAKVHVPEEGNPGKERDRRKQPQNDNPLAHIKCAGCGQKGVMDEQYIQAPSGAPVKVLICSSCGNQVL